MKGSIKAIITLTLITVVAGVLLGYVYDLTKAPIERQQEIAKQNAYMSVFSNADSFVEDAAIDVQTSGEVLSAAGFNTERIDEIMVATDSAGNKLGYVMSVTTAKGYGGDITISMGVTNDGVLNGVEILTISETAGLGMKATSDDFKNQFANKKVAQFTFTKTGAVQDYEIDALSGATITTTAFVDAVNAGLTYIKSIGGAVNE